MENNLFLSNLQNLSNANKNKESIKYTDLYEGWQGDLNFDFKHCKKFANNKFILYSGRVVECVLYPTFDARHLNFIERVLNGTVCKNYALIVHDRDLIKAPLFSDKCKTVVTDDCEPPDKCKITCNEAFDCSQFITESGESEKYKKLHVHCICYMQDTDYTNIRFAKKFGLDSEYVFVFGKLKPRLQYLVHGFNAEKATYTVDDVCGTSYMLEKLDNSLVLDLLSGKEQFVLLCKNFESLIKENDMVTRKDFYYVVFSSGLSPFYNHYRIMCERMIDEYILLMKGEESCRTIKQQQKLIDVLSSNVDDLEREINKLKER